MDGGTLEKRDSCSLISSSISTWTRAAPVQREGDQEKSNLTENSIANSLSKNLLKFAKFDHLLRQMQYNIRSNCLLMYDDCSLGISKQPPL